jgi:hypothetical protein
VRVRGRRIGVAALLVVGALLWTAFGLALWAERQALDTDNWVDTSENLLEDEEIRVALGNFIVDRLFDSDEVEARLEESLPAGLDQLAAPAAAGLKEATRRSAPRLLGSAVALEAWRRANEAAHGRLLDILEGREDEGEVTLDLEELFQQVADGSGLPAGAADRLPPEVASLEIAQAGDLEAAQEALDLFEALVWVLLVLAVLAFVGAVALSPDRRRTVLSVGGCLMFAALAVLAIRRLAGEALVDALAEAPNAMAAADDVWEIATSLLVDATNGSFLLGLFVVVGAWLAGPGRRATAARRRMAPAFREHPGYVRGALGAAILLLVIWGPVPWTERFWTAVAFTVAAFVWLEWIARRALEEHEPSPPTPQPTPEVTTT